MTDILPITFGISLASSILFTPNYLTPIQFVITVGDMNQPAYFKDVRVWSTTRSAEDLYTYWFK